MQRIFRRQSSFENMNVEERIRAILIQRFKRSAYWILRYLSYRRDPNIKDNFGSTLLHMVASASLDNLAIVQYLVELGADINVQDKYHLTPLHLAITRNNYKIADFLISQGAEVNIQDKDGDTALHILIDDMDILKKQGEREKEEKSLGLVGKLLQRGADPNLPAINGETSLMRAVRQNNLTVVKELLMFGANVHLRNFESDTCLHLLLRLYKPDKGILVELIKHGACVNCFGSEGNSTLNFILQHYPEEEGLETVKLLIKIATLVNWENKMWFDLGTNLEFYGLEEFIDNCYAEVSQMKSCTYSDKSNLCHFALNGGNASQTDKSGESIFDEALETLIKNSFPIYDDYIRVHFDRTFLLEKTSKMNIYAKNKEPNKVVHLNSHVILEVASYLEDEDLYNLVRAYSKPDIPRIKKDKINQVAN